MRNLHAKKHGDRKEAKVSKSPLLDRLGMESIVTLNTGILNHTAAEDDESGFDVRRRLAFRVSGHVKAIEQRLTIPEDCPGDDMATKKRKNFFRNFVTTTTVHGLDQIFINRSLCIKLFWFGVTVLVTLIFCTQVSVLLRDYLDKKTVTIVRVSHPKEGIPFPYFSLCPLSTINWTKAMERFPKLNLTLLEYATASFTSPSSTALEDYTYFSRQANIDPRNISAVTQFYEHLDRDFQFALDGFTYAEFIETVSFTCHDMFTMCWVENDAVFDCCTGLPLLPPSEEPRKLDPSIKPIATMDRFLIHSGACFQFDMKNFNQTVPGAVGGFGFVFNYPNEHLLQSAFKTHSGYALHLYTSQADAILERSPTILSVGHYSHVRVRTSANQRVDLDVFRNNICEDPQLKYFANYSYSNCQAECSIDVQLEKCSCIGVTFVGAIPRNKTCSPKEALLCTLGRMVGDSKKQRDKLVKCRIDHCREPCSYSVYHPTLTMARVFNPILEHKQMAYWGFPPTTSDNRSIADSLVIGEIYFDEIEVTSIEEKAALTFETFLSSIGGAMGFWTGASIISVVHVVFFCVYKCCMLGLGRQPIDDDEQAPSSTEQTCITPDNCRQLRRPTYTYQAINNDGANGSTAHKVSRV